MQKKNIDVNKNEIVLKLKKNYEEIKSKLINIDVNKNGIVLQLKKNYEEIKSKLIDQELFSDYLG